MLTSVDSASLSGSSGLQIYSRPPITRTFKGNRKKVRVIGSSKKIARDYDKKQFLLHSEHFNHI